MQSPRIVRLAVICFVVIFLSGFGAGNAQAFGGGKPEVYGLIESFNWKEFDDDGSRLLEESGPRFGAGFAYYRVFRDGMTLKPRVELYGGHVDYDGQTQSGIPVKSNTNYFAFKFEIDAGGRLGSQNVSVEPFGGFGFRVWSRDIEDSVTVTGTPAYGYLEEWSTFYFRAGMRMDALMPSEVKWFLEAGVKIPLYTENYISDLSYENLTLKPKGRVTPFAEAGFRAQRFKMSMYYDSMRFRKSNVVSDGIYYYWQPKSESYVIGIRIGRSF